MFFLLDCLNVFQTVSNSLKKNDNEVDNEIDNGIENPPAVTLEGKPKRDGGRSPLNLVTEPSFWASSLNSSFSSTERQDR